MPELRKILVIGGGFAGIACAIQARRTNPTCRVTLLEKSDKLLGWMDRKALREYPVGSFRKPSNPYPDRPQDWLYQERLLDNWDLKQIRELLGTHLEETRDGVLISKDLTQLRGLLRESLERNQVELRFGFSVESISTQPDGSYRVWSRDGEGCQGNRVVFATGGERNHCLRLAADLGIAITQPVPAFVRLRLASPKLGDRMGPLERPVKVTCLKSGLCATGLMTISSRGLEGSAISSLSASQCFFWNKLSYQLLLEVDWLPEQTGGSVFKEILSRSERGGKRLIAETPMFSFPARSWRCLLNSAKIADDMTWARIKTKKLQALANRLKADRMTTMGMGMPEGERAWSGGIDMESLHPQTLEAQSSPGMFFAGEILNLHGLPGGEHQNLTWATAWIAGSAAVNWI